jgi:hypothetical protein
MVWLDLALEDLEGEVEGEVQRRRTSPRAVVQWLVRHAAGLSLREASASEVEGLRRSHNALWKGIQKLPGAMVPHPKTAHRKIQQIFSMQVR